MFMSQEESKQERILVQSDCKLMIKGKGIPRSVYFSKVETYRHSKQFSFVSLVNRLKVVLFHRQ